MARQVAVLILAAVLAGVAPRVGAASPDPRTPQTPWASLSPEERRVLAPVAPDWERLPGYQQQRLISSARRFPSLQPIQKERYEERIRDWAAMTPKQREAAREAYQGLRKLPPEKQHELRERYLKQKRERGPDEGPRQRERQGPR
jgi:hypothetical protein